MNRPRLLILFSFFALVAIWSCNRPITKDGVFGIWKIEPRDTEAHIPWIDFYWAGDSIGNRWVEKMAMMVPAHLNGLDYPFHFQFDIGADITRLYGNTLDAYLKTTYSLANRCSIKKQSRGMIARHISKTSALFLTG